MGNIVNDKALGVRDVMAPISSLRSIRIAGGGSC